MGSGAHAVRRTVTTVVFTIAALAFAFGFGNGWTLGLQLGVPGWIAPLVAPAVDLSVVGLLTTLHFLRTQGVRDRLIGPRLLLVFCGFVTFALNTARPILAHQVGRACFDAIAPLLLIGWSEVGPRLLTLVHGTVPDRLIHRETFIEPTMKTMPFEMNLTNESINEAEFVPDENGTIPNREDDGTFSVLFVSDELHPDVVHAGETGVLVAGSPASAVLPPNLVVRARHLDQENQRTTGRRITRDKLRAELRVSNAIASELVRIVRTAPDGGASS
jgi:hypothetical protein